MDIEFDPKKAASNLRKHGVSFEEGATALLDEAALVIEDDSQGEHRWVLLGMSAQGRRLVVVVYTLRGETIRLISARKADKREEHDYASSL